MALAELSAQPTAGSTRRGMSLRSRIVLALTGVVGVYGVSDFYVRSKIFMPSFREVEHKEAVKDINRVVQALWQEIDSLHALSRNWSQHDNTYHFAESSQPEFGASDFAPERLRANQVDLLYACDLDGNVLWRHLEHPEHCGQELAMRMFPNKQLDKAHVLLGQERSGLLLTELGPMLVSSRPILPSNGADSSHGTLILGRFLSKSLDADLSERVFVEFDFWQLNDEDELPAAEVHLLDDLTSAVEPVVRKNESGELFAYATFPDISNRPDFLLRARVRRDIVRTGAEALRYAVFSMAAVCLVGLLALIALLQRIVLSPLSTLTDHAVRIGQKEDFSAKLDMQRHDEIGTLAGAFDAMMGKLGQARQDLMETARAAGMSEIATGILHNVGNVLNSVNISATLIADRVSNLGLDDIRQLAQILEENEKNLGRFVESDPRGKHLVPYVKALAANLHDQEHTIGSELRSLVGGIDHIRDLVRSQQDYAGRSELSEAVVLQELVEQALGITEKALGADSRLVVRRQYADIPPVNCDRHKVLEILVNLLQNARQAMDAVDREDKELTIAIELPSSSSLVITVTDNGIGIRSEDLVRIFQLGFTTKRSGHGFGLHSSANAATALGGSLKVSSAGLGKGASFMLEFPLAANLALGACQ